MAGSGDIEKLQEQFNKELEQKLSEYALQRRRHEFHQKFVYAKERVIHPAIMHLHRQWRGGKKHPKGRVLHAHQDLSIASYLQQSFEYTNCGRNRVNFILTIFADDAEEKVMVWRDFFKTQYDRTTYRYISTQLTKTEEKHKLEKVNAAWAQKMVTKGVWQARKIDLLEYLGPPDPGTGYSYTTTAVREDNYTSPPTPGNLPQS
jgi:hypothetical protein